MGAGGPPLTKTRPIGAAHPETRNFKFRWNGHKKGINQRDFKGPLKISRVNSFIKLRCYLTKGVEGGPPPLLNRVLLERITPNAKFQISLE